MNLLMSSYIGTEDAFVIAVRLVVNFRGWSTRVSSTGSDGDDPHATYV